MQFKVLKYLLKLSIIFKLKIKIIEMPYVLNVRFLLLSISTVVFPVVYYYLPESFSQMKSSMIENVQKQGLLGWATSEEETTEQTQRSISTVSESLMDNLLSRITNTTFSEDIAMCKDKHDIMTCLLWGTNLALFGNFAFKLYTQGFALCAGPTAIMVITSIFTIFQYAFKENIPFAILEFGDKTILKKLWRMLGLQKEEAITIVPSQEVGALKKLLKNVFPGVEVNGSSSIFKGFVQNILDIIGLDYVSIISIVVMAYALAFVEVHLYEIFLKEMEKKYWTDEELLEDYANNETLHKDLVEWIAVQRAEICDKESSDLTNEN